MSKNLLRNRQHPKKVPLKVADLRFNNSPTGLWSLNQPPVQYIRKLKKKPVNDNDEDDDGDDNDYDGDNGDDGNAVNNDDSDDCM